ncbi:MAG: hypothetical protein AAFO75_06870, partial [Pseudomonadota bacterium]
IWLASMGLVQLVLSLLAVKTLHIYTMVEYAIDFRFYLGWVIGLAVAAVVKDLMVRKSMDGQRRCGAKMLQKRLRIPVAV